MAETALQTSKSSLKQPSFGIASALWRSKGKTAPTLRSAHDNFLSEDGGKTAQVSGHLLTLSTPWK